MTMLDEISKVINDKREIQYDAFKCQDYLSQMKEGFDRGNLSYELSRNDQN